MENKDENIYDTIKEVSDISSATSPSFSDVNEWMEKSIKQLQEVDEGLNSFTSENNDADVKTIINNIESAMSKSKINTGKVRFINFKGVSENKALAQLQNFNEDKKIEEAENIDDTSQDYLQQVQADFEDNYINRKTYELIRSEIIHNGTSSIEDTIKNKTSTLTTTVAKAVSLWIAGNNINKEKSYLEKMQESESNELHNQSINQSSKDVSGSIIWKKGDKEISQGKAIDREELKKLGDLKTDTINGHEVNYMVKDRKLIIFKDNPDLTYFTEKGEQGRFNYWTAEPTKLYAEFSGANKVRNLGNKSVKWANKKLGRTPKATKDDAKSNIGEFGKFAVGYKTQQGIPIWNEIIGTSVPKTGSSEVILYMSEDHGETWDSKVRFEVDSEGQADSNDFSEQGWKDITKKALFPDW